MCFYCRLNDPFCCYTAAETLCFSVRWTAPENALSRVVTPSNTWFFGPSEVSPSNRISLSLAVLTVHKSLFMML